MHGAFHSIASSPIITRFIRALAIAERQLVGSRRDTSSCALQPDALGVWCHRCGETLNWARGGSGHDDDERVACEITHGCVRCAGKRIERDCTLRVGRYESELRCAILDVKHGTDRALARRLGRILGQQWIRRVLHASLAVDRAAIIPIPMPLARRVERGIDHTYEIAKGVSLETGIAVSRCLIHDAGPIQAMLSKSNRQLRCERIHCKRRMGVVSSCSHLLLVDDVLTTGSTLLEACSALRRVLPGASLNALVVAVSDRRKNA